MKLTFVGCGSAFSKQNYQTNALLEFDNGQKMLIDCGTTAAFGLRELGIDYTQIDAIYISHLHADHVGGLEEQGFCRFFDPRMNPPKLFISRYLETPLWSNTLSGGMRSLQGQICDLSTYFDVVTGGKYGRFRHCGCDFQMVQVAHIFDGFMMQPSFGLMWQTPDGKTVFFTADTQDNPRQMMDWYKQSDIIFHDCETLIGFESGVHAHYNRLKQLPPEIKKRMFLMHYQDSTIDQYDAEADGFAGFVNKGQEFDFSNPEFWNSLALAD